ncbi:MAG TPA: isochorismatase family protein [Micromonosporaceae bacterium]|jgi:nicotinamidase-related amidase
MATIREGNRTALVVVDLQVGVVAHAWNVGEVVANAALAVERARAAGVPVIWVQHSDKDLIHGSTEWGLVAQLVPAEGEPVIHKHFESSFEETELGEVLERLGISHIVLAGAASNWCIRATAYGALDRGYDLTLVKDAHTTDDLEIQGGPTIPAQHIVTDLNVAVRWLSYPGRANTTAAAAELEFQASA